MIDKKKKAAPKDFEKIKNKVGKAKAKARNFTFSDFKVKQVVVPDQSVLKDKKANAELSRRKLDLPELIAHCRHYNASVKKDALLQLRQVCSDHSEVLARELEKVVETASTCNSDDDHGVREESRRLLAVVLRDANAEALTPFAGIMITHLRGTLTHINSQIRVDGLLVLDLLLSTATGKHVVADAGKTMVTLCTSGFRAGSHERTLPVLMRLHKLAATQSTATQDDIFAPVQKVETLDNAGGKHVWKFVLDSWMEAAAPGDKSNMTTQLGCAALTDALLVRAENLGTTASLGPELERLRQLLFASFPWVAKASDERSVRVKLEGDNLNLKMVRMGATLLAVLYRSKKTSKLVLQQNDALFNKLVDFLEQISKQLAKTAVSKKSVLMSSKQAVDDDASLVSRVTIFLGASRRLLELDVDRDVFNRLVGIVDAMANVQSDTVPEEVALLSEARVSSVPLVATLLGIGAGCQWPDRFADMLFKGSPQRITAQVANKWIALWPRMLWYLGKSNPLLTGILLRLLLGAARSSPESVARQLFDPVQPFLLPFYLGMPGDADSSTSAPWVCGDAEQQLLAAGLVFHFTRLGSVVVSKFLRTIVLSTTLSQEAAELVVQIVMTHPHSEMVVKLRVVSTLLIAQLTGDNVIQGRLDRFLEQAVRIVTEQIADREENVLDSVVWPLVSKAWQEDGISTMSLLREEQKVHARQTLVHRCLKVLFYASRATVHRSFDVAHHVIDLALSELDGTKRLRAEDLQGPRKAFKSIGWGEAIHPDAELIVLVVANVAPACHQGVVYAKLVEACSDGLNRPASQAKGAAELLRAAITWNGIVGGKHPALRSRLPELQAAVDKHHLAAAGLGGNTFAALRAVLPAL